jgi:hypothetical protein
MKIQTVKKWAWSILGIAAVWKALEAVSCLAVAHASPEIAGDWRPSAADVGASTATWLLAALVALKAIEMLLAWVAPRTTTKLDDQALAAIHTVRETAEEILGHVKPPDNPPPGTLPAIVVSGTIEGAK